MRKYPLILAVLACIACVSCVKDPEPILDFDKDSISFLYKGGSSVVSFKANNDWTASSSADWCTLSQTEGKGSLEGEVSFTITCESSDGHFERSCSVTVASGGLTHEILIVQKYRRPYVVYDTELTLSPEEQDVKITLRTINDLGSVMMYDLDEKTNFINWASNKGVQAYPEVFALFHFKRNDTGKDRHCVAYITNDKVITDSVIFTQRRIDSIRVNDDKSCIILSPEKQSFTVDVFSDLNYEVKVDDAAKGWLKVVGTKSYLSSSLSVEVSENKGTEDRTGTIRLSKDDYEKSLTVTQLAARVGTVQFDDEYFKSYCVQKFDLDNDGEISYDEALRVKEMTIQTSEVRSLEAIKQFKFLDTLYVLSTSVKNLDVSDCVMLRYLDCENNPLESLVIGTNVYLLSLVSYNNPYIQSIDLSKCPNLCILQCISNNLTGSLDVTNNPKLWYCSCIGNPNLQYIYVKKGQIRQYSIFSYDDTVQMIEVD